MNKEILKEIVIEQNQALKDKDIGLEREALIELKKFFHQPQIQVISGLRRVGKSTLLRQIMTGFFPDRFYYLNFEDERLINFTTADFNLLYEIFLEIFGEKKVFFFDEIQNISGWENFIRRMQDNGFKFFLTGSNASMLSRELGTKLTGRHLPFTLYPFSFREFLNFKKISLPVDPFRLTKDRAKLKRLFNFYLKNGGMPEFCQFNRTEILKQIYEDILYRDIVARYDLKEVKALRELTLFYFSNLANLISFNKLKNFLKLGSVNTVKNYTEYLENSFLIFTVNLFSYSLAKQYIASKKIYCLDNGLANAISFRFSQDRGRFLENLVFIELKRRGKEIFYYKTKSNLEIDFFIREGNVAAEIIQVVASLADNETRSRELGSLKQAMSELNLSNGLILTLDEKEEIKDGSGRLIKILPVYQWLLKTN